MGTTKRRPESKSKTAALATALALAASVLLAASSARADTTQPSTIAQIKLVAPGDDQYKQYQGALWLYADKADYNYKWGGQQCSSVTLTGAQVELLIAAFNNKHSVVLDFDERTYKGRKFRCITAISVRR